MSDSVRWSSPIWRMVWPSPGYQPLRTRERAALDAARAALRKIARADAREVPVMVMDALERMSVILGEREGK